MEKLYNGIILEDGFQDKPSDANHIPYLENPPEVIDVTIGRQLFVDDFLIEKTDLSPVYGKAEKYAGNPVLSPETPLEKDGLPCAAPKSGGIRFDPERRIYQMWYEAGWLRHMAYAESKDGIHWERPDLGIVPGTNCILDFDGFEMDKLTGDGDVHYLRPDSSTVFFDPDAKPGEEYKLFLRNPGPLYPGIIATSHDGIHFENFGFTAETYDRSTAFYNPFRKKYIFSIRNAWAWNEQNQENVRSRGYAETDDFHSGWRDADYKRGWLATDSLDPTNDYTFYPSEVYNVDCVAYESIMLGMFQVYHGPANQDCAKVGAPKITELVPIYSRDGYHFSRPNRESLINASLVKGTWDRGYVQSVGGLLTVDGDEMRIWFIGFTGDGNVIDEKWYKNGMYSGGATGFATMRRDGFVSMSGKGTLLTRPMVFRGKKEFLINARGKVKTELLDREGNLLSTVLFEGDKTGQVLSFPNVDLAKMDDSPIRLRFTLDGDLFAFAFV